MQTKPVAVNAQVRTYAEKIEVLKGTAVLGSVTLSTPATMPAAEENAAPYSTTAWHAKIPAAWIQPGISLRVIKENTTPTIAVAAEVGPETTFTLRVLPFYLFGATPTNSVAQSIVSQPDANTKNILASTWPMATLSTANHPAQSVSWPSLVVPPRGGRAAYGIQNKDEQTDPFDGMVAVLGIMQAMRSANGEANASLHYYAPMMMLDRAGTFKAAGGGYGGGSAGAGSHTFEGVFIHEHGHAFGLGHGIDAYEGGTYPYVGGSLKGSQWAWDSASNVLRSPYVPASATNRKLCTAIDTTRQFDAQGRCFKQDPMQSGDGDQPPGVRYATFSDFSLARMQSYMEARQHPDSSFASGFKKWDFATSQWKEAGKATLDGGLKELDGGLPDKSGVAVHTVVVSYSMAGSLGASFIYNPISYVGNLPRTIDPTDSVQRASISPDTRTNNYWYCKDSGCDYTLKVTYADGSLHHAVINRGFRSWFKDDFKPGMNDPLSSESFRLWVLNVPGDKAIQKIEILNTPKVWQGMPQSNTVLLQRTF